MSVAIASAGQSTQPVAGKVTVVYFWAVWCAPCRQLSPALQQMADTDHDIAFKKINADEDQSEVQAQYITALPVVKV